MVSDLTPAELTLLGLLAEKPRHGYELEEVIIARGMRDWTEIGFSSIYYLLGPRVDRRDRRAEDRAGQVPQGVRPHWGRAAGMRERNRSGRSRTSARLPRRPGRARQPASHRA